MGTGPSTRIDRHGIHNLSVNSCLETTKTYIGSLMVATAGWAARPVNCERIRAGTHLVVERFGESDCAALRFNESEIAVIGHDAGDQRAHGWRGARRGLLDQRCSEEAGHSF